MGLILFLKNSVYGLSVTINLEKGYIVNWFMRSLGTKGFLILTFNFHLFVTTPLNIQ